MTVSREDLIKRFVTSIEEDDAALFIGAGMSRPSGYVNWKELLRECARELNLDLDREQDLVAVAQYYLNRRHDRSRLNQIISKEFKKPVALSENHKIISRLPISTIWTTNYDSLIEDALEANKRKVDVKSRDKDVPIPSGERDTVLYKMHGDVSRPDEVIICKDDYERYAKSHYILQHALENDLISKTFLFLGFSFSDPNLDYMLGHLRSLLEESKREHYAIMRKVRLNRSIENEKERQKLYEYNKNKQNLQIEDLQRYSIQTHLIEKFSEVTDILNAIEQAYLMKNVFVSGSAINFGELGEERVRDLCFQLGERIIDKGYRLISGVGLNIGDSVVKGTLLKLYEKGVSSIEKKLTVRPFPRNLPPNVKEEEFNRTYREVMIKKCGFAIFISGNSHSAPELSQGVLDEFSIATKLKKVPIPIGATGFAAQHIWKKLEPNIEKIYSGRVPHTLFQKLNDPTLENSEILDAVFSIMHNLRDI